MQNRIEIERSILGSIIFYNGFAQVAHILSPKNFTSTGEIHNREVYQAIQKLFPDKPIDLVTVLRELSIEHPGKDTGQWVFACNTTVLNSANIAYWAIILLQIDISEKYKDQLIFWRDQREKEFQTAAKAELEEMIESMKPGIDIFDMVEQSVMYFEKQDMKREYEGAKNFSRDFTQKAIQIRQVTTIKTILQHLFDICATSLENKVQCEAFGKAIADIVSTGQTNDRYTKAISILYN